MPVEFLSEERVRGYGGYVDDRRQSGCYHVPTEGLGGGERLWPLPNPDAADDEDAV